ncbi:AAA family ATPase [Devosia sp. MC521]|uniref:AAA family ATPase n=1 Tax=Devosia sp. MC521 TaxID=2759954 RepID=UPI0015F97A82|nr:AAA family ATPase [Devosia sp. MC521]MBJ6988959.1 AAA family ATPase [Devosia sp. MC521]QMW64391.1 AAA family ATPase [Devosia sp. MC521]
MLSAISVLDRDCAAIHVRGANEVAFRPLGLDVPDELAAACQSIKDALTSEQEHCQQSQDKVFIKPTFSLATAVGQVMTSLTAKTDLSTMHRIASLSVDEEARLQRLGEDLLRDSAKVASEQRGLAHSLQRFSQQLETLLQNFNDVEISATNSLRADAATKRGAAKMATQMAMSGSTIAGVGEASWKVLWEAARQFADQHSHPGYHFPDGPPDQACVLCQQELSGEAKSRMNAFEAFVKDKTEVDADNADAALKRALKAVKDSTVCLAAFPMHHQLKSIDPALAKVVRRSLAVARSRRSALLSINGRDVPTVPGFPGGAVEGIQSLIAKALAYASELDGAADQVGRKKLEDELAELRDRKALSDLIPKAELEIRRLAMLDRIETCLGETATRAVTTLGNAIADDVITPKVRDRFQLEIQKLASTRVRVDIVRSGGRFGSPQYAVQLFANQKAKVAAVLSEGEQTCVAIAAFMTELATAPHSSALVFDDPVSSLDHRWRQKVAERLVEEASVRQVIVFTHDLVFLNDLETAAVSANTPHGVVSLSQGVDGAGIVEEGLPWVGAKIPERIDTLEKEARAAAKLFNAMDDQGYAAAAAQFYSKLRSSWERALEDVAFCGVLNRHRDYINAKNLRNVVALTEDDVTAWAAGFKICCDQTDAHDPSRGRNASPPPPEDLLKHVGELSAWVAVLKGRQKDLTSPKSRNPADSAAA